MKIKVLGSNCSKCGELENRAKTAVKELGIKADIEKITDIQVIIGYGVMSLPGLVVDERVKFSGRVPTVDELKKILK